MPLAELLNPEAVSASGSESGESDDDANCSQPKADGNATDPESGDEKSEAQKSDEQSENVENDSSEHTPAQTSSFMIMKENLPELWPNHCRMPSML